MQDHEIIDLYFARDEQAIIETDKSYGPVCMQVSMNILQSRLDAEECVNDTYLKAWNSIPPERPKALRVFLCRITRNLSIDRFRYLHRHKRNRDLEVILTDLESCIATHDEASDELIPHITEFLRSEDRLDRMLFVGRYFFADSMQTLAKKSGLNQNLISVRLYRVRERLRKYLIQRGYGL